MDTPKTSSNGGRRRAPLALVIPRQRGCTNYAGRKFAAESRLLFDTTSSWASDELMQLPAVFNFLRLIERFLQDGREDDDRSCSQ